MDSVKRISAALLVGALMFFAVGYAYKNYGHGIALLVNMVCLGAVTAYIASGKNRSKLGWFIIGTFTGIIGLGLVLGIKPIEKDKNSKFGLRSEEEVKSVVGES